MPEIIAHEGYSSFEIKGNMPLDVATAILKATIAQSVSQGVRKLLIDSSELGGFDIPDVVQRYSLAEGIAALAAGKQVIAIVTRAEYIDPKRFGIVVAANRGLLSQVFSCKKEAVAWLLACRQPGAQVARVT